MDDIPSWQDVVAIIVSVAAVRISEWLATRYPDIAARVRSGRDRAHRVLATRDQWCESLQHAREELGAERVLLLRTSNGGGLLNPEMPIYSSAIAPIASTLNWDKQLVDPPYIRMLLELLKSGEVRLDRETMEPGLLKDLYESLGIKSAWVFLIRHRADGVFYLTVSFEDSQANLTAFQRVRIRSLVNAIRLGISSRPGR